MVDPKATAALEVLRNGARVGTLTRSNDGSRFRYTDEFLASSEAPVALHLPKDSAGTEARGTTNLPAFFAGLLPEGVMQDAVVRAYRLSRDDLFSQLAVTGYDAIGDVTVRVPGQAPPPRLRSPAEAKKALEAILAGGRIPNLNTVSGVQPKLSIGESFASARGTRAIVKIEPPRFPGILENEAYFMRVARKAGLSVANVKLEGDLLVVERFDRVKRPGHPPEQIHVEDALQVLDRYPLAKYSLDYTEIMDAAVALRAAASVQLDLLRLYAFSYAIGNGDLHAKNVSFEYRRDTGRWQTTPAYDLVCTLPYDANGPPMALPLNEQSGGFEPEDFRRVGARYGVPPKAVDSMLVKAARGIVQSLHATPVPISQTMVEEVRSRASQLGAI